jgi:hypothetical protein
MQLRVEVPAAVVAMLFVSGCTCGDALSRGRSGELFAVDGNAAVVSALDLDFGAVVVGEAQVLEFQLQNRGAGALALVAPEAASPFRLEVPASVAPGSLVTAKAIFTPDAAREFSSTIELVSPDALESARRVTLRLRGTGTDSRCAVVPSIDFGVVSVGSSRAQLISLENPRPTDVTAIVGQPTGGDLGPFVREAPSRAEVLIPPMGRREVRLAFRPSSAGRFLGSVNVQPAPACPAQLVTLVGVAIDGVISATPNPVLFGFVPLTRAANRTVSVTNGTAQPLDVQLTWPAGGEFSGPARVAVPAFDAATFDAVFRPSMLGNRAGSVGLRAGNAPLVLQLRGAGGGPDIDVRPAIVNFGRVPLFTANTPPQTRRLQVLNVGTRATMTTAERLFLGRSGAAPYAVLQLPDGGAAPPNLAVNVAATPPYSDASGLDARPGEYVGLEVQLTPVSAGPVEAQLVVFSNDHDEPDVRVPITANVVPLRPCSLGVLPSGQLQFGALTANVPSVRQVVLENRSTTPGDVCLISELALAPDSHAAFSLLGGPVAERELLPGERWSVRLQALTHGGGTGPIAGTLTYSSSAPTPVGSIQLVANLERPCLTVSPIELDVGAVNLGCSSGPRSFLIYNSCSAPVDVQSVTVVDAAGLPANTPGCTAPAGCPEVSLAALPMLPATLASGATPLAIAVRYQPVDVGADTGAIAITSTARGQTTVQLVSVRSQGNASGDVTEVFQGAGIPRVDILFVIDGSCSMSSKQASLAANLPAFFTRALATNVDYHLAVIVGQGPPSVPTRGVFRSGPTHPTPILTQGVADAEQQFGARITSIGAQGGNEECFQPALTALTPPLSTGSNAGFLRAGAQLAIVCVTDDSDYSPQPAAYYQAEFLNLKQGQSNDLTVSAIAGYQQACSATQLEDGRYAAMTAATGGVREEICTADWAQALGRLSLTTFGQSGRYFLRGSPDLSARPLEVRVDGALISPTMGPAHVWSYDAVGNVISFAELFRPPAGARIEVRYRPACL